MNLVEIEDDHRCFDGGTGGSWSIDSTFMLLAGESTADAGELAGHRIVGRTNDFEPLR